MGPDATITGIRLDADPSAWEAAGFAVEGTLLRVGPTTIRFEPGCRGQAGAGAICGWTLAGIEAGDLDGLPTRFGSEADELGRPEHLNTVRSIDHVVVFSSELERTIAAFEASGIECRRVREVPIAPDRVRQAFFRIGPSIVEVIEVPADKAGPERRTRFWGLAFLAADLEAAAELLGPKLGRIKDAVQPGRRIATVRREAGLGISVALISPQPDREPA